MLNPQQEQCYHCGETIITAVTAGEKVFCCKGCKMVYELLNDKGLCDYYSLTKQPGTALKEPPRKDKFRFLEDEKMLAALISFKDETQIHTTFYLPQMHCSSCLWLLEHLNRLNKNVVTSKVDFPAKKVSIVFNYAHFSLRQLAELLTSIGYEPYISLHDLKNEKPKTDKRKIYKLGVAGFCFANTMLLSFPEYFGINASEKQLLFLFRYVNVLLSVPIIFYSASEFYISAYKSLRHGFLNIDAPIVIAIAVTFCRSLYEVLSGTGSGYFDSMSGIVFFMLAGRVLQSKTYDNLNFERDYTSYFPVSVSIISKTEEEQIKALPEIELNHTLLIHHNELIPADGILTKGKALIDYSFVTGESLPVEKEMGEIVYAGGRQTASNIEVLVIKEVAQSYLTHLWNRHELKKEKASAERSFTQFLSRSFTWFVLVIALATAMYWYVADADKMWRAATAVLIVACPCALLLSNTFTNGNILRILSRNGLYLRNAQVIEEIANTNQIIFDKTGTLTTHHYPKISYHGKTLTNILLAKIATLASQSTHPLSKAIALNFKQRKPAKVLGYKEFPGEGIEGFVDEDLIMLGSNKFVKSTETSKAEDESVVFVSVESEVKGKFVFHNEYRKNVPALIQNLQHKYELCVLSGDNAGEKNRLRKMFGNTTNLLFHQTPVDKLNYVITQQQQGKKVMMIGDGLNDAGALKQAETGIAVTEDTSTFTPFSDAILQANSLSLLPAFIRLCTINKKIVLTAFIISIIYNIVGIYFAVTASLSPMIAAILMPCSSISILLITYGFSNLSAWKLKLK